MVMVIPAFKHRKNSDVSFDSICTTCYLTIGKRKNEAELEQDEKAHVCEHPHRGLSSFDSEPPTGDSPL